MMVLLRFLAPNNIRACCFAALGLVGFSVLELINIWWNCCAFGSLWVAVQSFMAWFVACIDNGCA